MSDKGTAIRTWNEAYTESYEHFLRDWEKSMDEIYGELHIPNRSHLEKITRHASEHMKKSEVFKRIRTRERADFKNDIAYQMALYYFFKKKFEWVRRMEKVQHSTSERTHTAINGARTARH